MARELLEEQLAESPALAATASMGPINQQAMAGQQVPLRVAIVGLRCCMGYRFQVRDHNCLEVPS